MKIRHKSAWTSVFLCFVSALGVVQLYAEPNSPQKGEIVSASGKTPRPKVDRGTFANVEATTPEAETLIKELGRTLSVSVGSSDRGALDQKMVLAMQKAAQASLRDLRELLDKANATRRIILKKGAQASVGEREKLTKTEERIASLKTRISQLDAESRRISAGRLPKAALWNAAGAPLLTSSDVNDSGSNLVLRTARGEKLPLATLRDAGNDVTVGVVRVKDASAGDPLVAYHARIAAALGLKVRRGGGQYQVGVWKGLIDSKGLISNVPSWVSPPVSEGALEQFLIQRKPVVAQALGASAVPAAVSLSAMMAYAKNQILLCDWEYSIEVPCLPPMENENLVDVKCIPGTPVPDTETKDLVSCEVTWKCTCLLGDSSPKSFGCDEWKTHPDPNEPWQIPPKACKDANMQVVPPTVEIKHHRILHEGPACSQNVLFAPGVHEEFERSCWEGFGGKQAAVNWCAAHCLNGRPLQTETMDCCR